MGAARANSMEGQFAQSFYGFHSGVFTARTRQLHPVRLMAGAPVVWTYDVLTLRNTIVYQAFDTTTRNNGEHGCPEHFSLGT